MPKIGEPVLTSDVQKFFENTVIDLPESEAMPEFWEPEAPTLKTTEFEARNMVDLNLLALLLT